MTLPALMDRNMIMAETGLPKATVERIMRELEKVRIGRRVFVERSAVEAYLRERSAA